MNQNLTITTHSYDDCQTTAKQKIIDYAEFACL